MIPARKPEAWVREEEVLQRIADAVEAETRRCCGVSQMAYQENKELRPNAAKIALIIKQRIEDGDVGF